MSEHPQELLSDSDYLRKMAEHWENLDNIPEVRAHVGRLNDIAAALASHKDRPLAQGWVKVPEWRLRRAIEILECDGDEHGIAAELWAMLQTAPPTPPTEKQTMSEQPQQMSGDEKEGYAAGLAGEPIGFVSEAFDRGWYAGEKERTCTIHGRKQPMSLTPLESELLEALRGVLRVADRATDEFIAARVGIAKAEAQQSIAPTDLMDWKLPCDVTVGNTTHCKGTSLGSLVAGMEMQHEEAFRPAPSPEQQAVNLAILQGVAPLPADDEFGHTPTTNVFGHSETWRHKTTGNFYTKLGAVTLQTTEPLGDMEVLVLYQGENGRLWAREVAEFHHRFDRVTDEALPLMGSRESKS